MNISSKKDLAALAFPPSEFEYLLGKTPFRMILNATEDNAQVYQDLCSVGKLLLSLRDQRPLAAPRHLLGRSPLPKQLLNAETRELCERAEMNIRTARRLIEQTSSLIHQTQEITSRTYTGRREMGAALRELSLRAEVGPI